MKDFLKRILVPFSLISGLVLSTPVLGDVYGGSEGEEIILNGTVIFGGIGDKYISWNRTYVQKTPIVLVKYKGKLYRCTVDLDIELDKYTPSQDGFTVSCWERREL